MIRVPFLELKTQHALIREEIQEALEEVFDGGRFVGGEIITRFESTFAQLIGARHCVAVGNGTDSLFIALKTLGIGPGDEVITPAWSWISTSETISLAGASPIFADADPQFFNVDVNAIEQAITSKTKAVIVVHLYGHPADMEKIERLCKERNLYLIEDCSHAHLASMGGRKVGTWGTLSCFSFFPTKNLGAYGDAGCVVTADENLAIKARRFCNHGGLTKDEHLFEGINSRMDTLQAAVLRVKLRHLEAWTTRRIKNAAIYSEQLRGLQGVHLPVIRDGSTHVYHLYVIRTDERKALQEFLLDSSIETMIHYPCALPFEEAYRKLDHKPGQFPNAHQFQQDVLSLPIYPELTEDQISYVCRKIREFCE